MDDAGFLRFYTKILETECNVVSECLPMAG